VPSSVSQPSHKEEVENREQKGKVKAHLQGLERDHEAERCKVLRGSQGKGYR
jgi:hypothetical protein